jgi:hypothetical protein
MVGLRSVLLRGAVIGVLSLGAGCLERPGGDDETDGALRRLVAAPEFIGFEGLRYEVAAGGVTLDGVAPGPSSRDELERRARQLPGVCEVTSRITLRK